VLAKEGPYGLHKIVDIYGLYVFKQLGLSTTEAINLFYRQIKMRKGLPFNVVIPNKTTEKVFKDTDIKRNLIRCDGTDDMFEKLGI